MKKILAILLASALLVSVLAVIAIPAIADEAKPFWVTHYNDLTAEGAGVIVTTSDLNGGSWNNYYAFTPVAGTDAYEITAVSIGVGTGTAALPAIPEGGFVYSINVGNNYPEINVDGSGINYTSDNCNNMVADVESWAVGDKFTFVGLDLAGLTVPTSTAGTNWYDPSYVCTATYSVYVAEDEESTPEESLVPDSFGATVDGNGDYTFENAYGYEFAINYVNGTIAGEDNTLITSADAYAACNPNWAISVVLVATDVANEYTVDRVVVTPGSADAAGIDWNVVDAVLVAHSAYSNPNGTNWMSKVAACALKTGDVITVNADQTLATVSAPAVDEESSVEDSSVEDSSVEDSSVEDSSDVVEDADFTVDLTAEGDLTVGSTVTVVVSVNNITAENGLHVVKFVLNYDPTVLSITNDLDELNNNCLDALTTVPNEETWENFCKVAYDFDEDTEIATAKNDGIVNLSALTDKMLKSQAAKEDGSIVFTLTFEVIAEATETVVSVNDPVEGAFNVDSGVINYTGVGSSVTLPVIGDVESSDVESSEVESSDVESSDVESSDVESSDVESSEVESSDVESSEVESSDVESSDAESSDSVNGDELVGEPNADAQFNVVLDADGELTVGSTVTVVVSINDITAERGLHLVKLILNYDPSVLKITNDLVELENNCLDAVTSLPTEAWENFCKVAYDFDEDTEIATAKNDGIVELSALTEQTLKSQAAKEDGAIQFTLTFEVIGEANETIIYVPNATVEGASNSSNDIARFAGNGSYVTVLGAIDEESSDVESSDVESSDVESSDVESSDVESSDVESSDPESSDDESDSTVSGDTSDDSDESDSVAGDTSDDSDESDSVAGDTSDDSDESVDTDASTDASTEASKDDSSAGTPSTGDVSSMIVFVVLAIVALAGSAVVIKTRK